VSVREWWQRVNQHWTTYVLIAGGVALFLLVLVGEYRRWRHSRLSPVEGIALCYEGMTRLGQQLGAARRPWDTPAEYSAILVAAVRARVARWPWRGRRVIPVTREAGARVRAVSSAYERASYDAHSVNKRHQMLAEREWERLRRELRWLRFSSQVGASMYAKDPSTGSG
jgi:hypothetical protein